MGILIRPILDIDTTGVFLKNISREAGHLGSFVVKTFQDEFRDYPGPVAYIASVISGLVIWEYGKTSGFGLTTGALAVALSIYAHIRTDELKFAHTKP